MVTDTDLSVRNFVDSLSNGRTCLSQKMTLLKVLLCKTIAFQLSFFNPRITKLFTVTN